MSGRRERPGTKEPNMNYQAAIETALAAIVQGEAANMSKATMNKRYKALFAAQGAAKTSGAW